MNKTSILNIYHLHDISRDSRLTSLVDYRGTFTVSKLAQ